MNPVLLLKKALMVDMAVYRSAGSGCMTVCHEWPSSETFHIRSSALETYKNYISLHVD